MSSIWFSLLNSDEKNLEENVFQPEEKHFQPLFGKPIEIGCYSIDDKSVIHFDTSQLKYLVSPLKTRDLKIDLNLNFNVDVHRHYVRIQKMHDMLYWLLNSEKSSLHNNFQISDFVTVRGTLKLIACTPYLNEHYRDHWEICASKFKGTIYLSAIESDADIEEDKNMTRRQAMLQAWGYKFEQYVTTRDIDGKCDIDSRTFQLEEYCVVLKSILENFSLLYTAEIDAAIPHRYPGPGSGNTACYTELKTSRVFTTDSQKYFFNRCKLPTWWAQSYLTGIPEILCGFRDDDGIVKEIKFFSVSKLPENAWGWSTEACLSFCLKFLKFLKKTVIEDDPNVVYRFIYKGGDIIYCSKTNNTNPRYQVIPDWYIKGVKKYEMNQS